MPDEIWIARGGFRVWDLERGSCVPFVPSTMTFERGAGAVIIYSAWKSQWTEFRVCRRSICRVEIHLIDIQIRIVRIEVEQIILDSF